MKAVILTCAAAMLACGAADARRKADTPSTPAAEVAPIKEIARCKALTDDTQRLACFDQATTTLLTAEKNADIIVVDKTEVEATNRSLFGFNLPDISLFRRHGASVEQVDRLEGVIASAYPDASGQWTFRLQDGSVWHQVDTNTFGREPHSGQPVSIKRAALGSYILSIDKTPGVKVRRIG